MRSFMTVILAGAAGCSIAGKIQGPAITKPTPPSVTRPSVNVSASGGGASASSLSREPGTLGAGFEADPKGPPDGVYSKLPPYPSAPADPWAAVDGDQPRRWSAEAADHWVVRGNAGDCSAAHDHCLDKDAWFLVPDHRLTRELTTASVHVFGPDGPASPANAGSGFGGDKYTAFRTVPATRHNIAVGSIVIGLSRGTPVLGSGQHAITAYWNYGTVEELDVDIGVYKLKGAGDTAQLTGARVVVLSWQPGGKVKIVGGKKRDQLAVKASDVFLPDAKP